MIRRGCRWIWTLSGDYSFASSWWMAGLPTSPPRYQEHCDRGFQGRREPPWPPFREDF